MAFLKNLIDISTESFTDQPTCTVNLSAITSFCSVIDITDTDQEGLQVIYDVNGQFPGPVLTRSFSFDALRKSPLKCKEWIDKQIENARGSVDYPARKEVVDKIIEHAVFLADRRHAEGRVDSGYEFKVTLDVLLFSHTECIMSGKFRGLNRMPRKTTCSVCLDDLKDRMHISYLPCNHVFHSSCIGPWLDRNKTCPNCRSRLPNISVSREFLQDLSILDARFVKISGTKPKCGS